MDSWENDMACVMNDLGPCRANIFAACLCRNMPELVYREHLESFAPKPDET